MRKKRACDHAVDLLREYEVDGFMRGDIVILDDIANLTGIVAASPLARHEKVIQAISKTPGLLKVALVCAHDSCGRKRTVKAFFLD